MDLVVGQRVVVKSLEEIQEDTITFDPLWVSHMDSYCGQECVIDEKIDVRNGGIHVSLHKLGNSGSTWWFSHRWLVGYGTSKGVDPWI